MATEAVLPPPPPVTPAAALDEQLQGGPAPTQLGRVFQELGIRWVPASSPQAKGRIERLFATLQDRLVTELRLARIRDRDRANAFLPGFVQAHNVRFSQAAAQPGSAYRPWPLTSDPEAILCFKYLRMVAKDNTVTVGPHRLQLLPGPGGRSYAHIRVEVREHLDGRLTAAYHGQSIPSAHLTSLPDRLKTIPARKHPRVKVRRALDSRTARKVPHPPQARRPRPWKPSPTHPWHVLMRQEMRRKTLREAGVTFSSAT